MKKIIFQIVWYIGAQESKEKNPLTKKTYIFTLTKSSEDNFAK